MHFKQPFRPLQPICEFVNNRRDTFLYCGIVGISAANNMFGLGLEAWGLTARNLCQIAGVREIARSVVWGSDYFGGRPHMRFALSAAAFGMAPSFISVLASNDPESPSHRLMNATLLVAGAAVVTTIRGGPMTVVRDYGEMLWDWPSKNKPRGRRKMPGANFENG